MNIDELYKSKPELLAQWHWAQSGDFTNPYPAATDEFRRYEEKARQICLDWDNQYCEECE